jgi:hypothetical protein
MYMCDKCEAGCGMWSVTLGGCRLLSGLGQASGQPTFVNSDCVPAKPTGLCAELEPRTCGRTYVHVCGLPQASDRLDKYVSLLVEARKKKGMTRETAADLLVGGSWANAVVVIHHFHDQRQSRNQCRHDPCLMLPRRIPCAHPAPFIKGDVNFFGTLMVAAGDADGMVSGALHTTASTIRPALQVRPLDACAYVFTRTRVWLCSSPFTSCETTGGLGAAARGSLADARLAPLPHLPSAGAAHAGAGPGLLRLLHVPA